MTSLVALTFLIIAQGPSPSPSSTDRPTTAAAPLDIVAAIESALADAIARAEPSVVSIHRHKGANPNETLAVRGRRRSFPFGAERDPLEFPTRPLPDDFISFDYGSGVVIGDRGRDPHRLPRGARGRSARSCGPPGDSSSTPR